MKRLHTGTILLDTIDILCLSFSAGSIIGHCLKKYRKYRSNKTGEGEDAIIEELKRESPIKLFSNKDKPLRLPLMRGGDNIRAFSLVIKSEKLAKIMMAVVCAKKNMRVLQQFLFILNALLSASTGFRIAAAGSLNYLQVILIVFPSSLGGMLLTTISSHPLASILLPITIVFARGIENISDPYEQCRLLCKTAEKYHNKQLMLKMENINSLLIDAPPALQKAPLVCVEEPLSLLERYKLKEVIKSAKARERVQYFSQFIKKFSQCDVDLEAIHEVIGNVQKISTKR